MTDKYIETIDDKIIHIATQTSINIIDQLYKLLNVKMTSDEAVSQLHSMADDSHKVLQPDLAERSAKEALLAMKEHLLEVKHIINEQLRAIEEALEATA
jgi:hypothetical protein